MKHNRVACTVIIGDDKTNESWSRLMDSVSPYVDHIFVNYNGSKDEFPYDEPSDCGFTWQKFDWLDDFSISRNQSFAMIKESGKEFDWYFWIDADDELVNGDQIQDMLNSLDENTDFVFLPYNYGIDPITGAVVAHHTRERFLKAGRRWIWEYPIHEVCHTDPGAQMAERDNIYIKHHRKATEDADNATRARNRRIIAKALSQDPNNPRHKFYMGNELYHEGFVKKGTQEGGELLVAAQKMYVEFIKAVGRGDDVYVANHRNADIHRLLDHRNDSIDADLQNLKINPAWPESWLGIAQCYLETGEWELAEYFANIIIDYIVPNLGKRQTQQVIEPYSEYYTPYLIRGLARENLGNLDGALDDLHTAFRNAGHDDVVEHINRINGRKAKGAGNETVKEARKRLYGTKADKSIAFVVPPTAEPWHPGYIDKFGSGGAEHCVVEIANRFANDGYRVAVFGTPGEYEGIDYDTGIEWWGCDDYGSGEKFSVVVSSRWPFIMDAKIQSPCKLLWMHDVNSGPMAEIGPDGNRFEAADGVICLTNWHKDYLTKMYKFDPDNAFVIGNGVNTSLFDGVDLSRGLNNKMIYSSSPDRGILTLLSYWNDIRSIKEDAELHVYYGWTGIDRMISAGQGGLRIFKEQVDKTLDALGREEAGIFWHNRVPRSDLVKYMADSTYWAYPTSFCETFCITAIEMQLAGVLPITSNLAALSEVVAGKNMLVDGWPNNEQYKKDWLKAFDALTKTPIEEIVELREIGKKHASAFTWDHAYDQWRELIAARTKAIA